MFHNATAQTTLKAIGSDTTYELINAVLAPGYNVIEVPDCGHPSFGRHITEVYDSTLETHVFKFLAHVHEDDDRCKNFDRQRTEIKSYDKSPAKLKAVLGEEIHYSWKFKIDSNFKPSKKFSHLHQLKSVDGPDDNMPLITLTAREGSPDMLELRYAEAQNQSTLTEIELDQIRGSWVEVIENVLFEEKGQATYQLIIKRINDNKIVLDYTNSTIAMWKVDASFIRPKWGIYRSLEDSTKLKDESVYFDNITIEEIEDNATVHTKQINSFNLYPNPASSYIQLSNLNIDTKSYAIFNLRGQEVLPKHPIQNEIDVSSLSEGHYTLILYGKNEITIGAQGFIKQ